MPVEVDDELWEASVAGDASAFALLYDRHVSRVYRHACRLVRSRADAEDVTAATFLELWRRRADVRVCHHSVLPWLLVTATNVSRNLTRSRLRYRRLLRRLPRPRDGTDVDAVAETALAGLGGNGYEPLLQQALDRLSRDELTLATLVMLEGYPVAEAAEALGITTGAAKSRLHRIRSQVKESLTASDAPEGVTP